MNNEAPIPFVARSRKMLTTPAPAGPEHRYDSNMQIWVCARTGEPLVLLRRHQDAQTLAASEFGETTLTKTVEGVDQSEARVDADITSSGYRGVSASEFGETTLTETGEGTDQTERTVGA